MMFLKNKLIKNTHRSWFGSRPTNITTYISTIMWYNTGRYKRKQVKTAQGFKPFLTTFSQLGQGDGSCNWESSRIVAPFETQARVLWLDNAKHSKTFLWHKSIAKSSHFVGTADWTSQSTVGLGPDSRSRGRDGVNVAHPRQRRRLDKEISYCLALAQGNGLFCRLQLAVLCRAEDAARL